MKPAHHINPLAIRCARLAIIGTAFFAVVMYVAFAFIQPELNPLHRFGSEYAVGRGGWLMKAAFFAWAGGILSLAVAMAKGLDPEARSLSAVVLLGLAAVGLAGAGIFDADLQVPNPDPPPLWIEASPTAEQIRHVVASFVFFLSLMAAAGLASRRLRLAGRLRGAYRALRYLSWLAPVMFLIFATYFVSQGLAGLGQRMFLLVLFAWVVLAARGIETGAFSRRTEALGQTLTAPDLLARGVERADRLSGEPLVQAEMLATIGRAYHGLGQVHRADTLFQRALAIRSEQLAPDDPQVAASLVLLAWSRVARSEFDDAADLFRRALVVQRSALGPKHPEVANSLHGLGLALNGLGRSGEALEVMEDARSIRRAAPGSTPVEIANGLNDQAIVLREMNDLEGAERRLREAMAMRSEYLPEGHPDHARTAQHLASLLHRMGRYAEAEALYVEALEGWRRSVGSVHPATLETVRGLDELRLDRGRLDEAARVDASVSAGVEGGG